MAQKVPIYRLNEGYEIPQIGFGTVGLRGQSGKLAVMDAIKNGYRFIDTSTNYNNEGIVGLAIEEAGLPREELLIGSKLRGYDHRFDDTLEIIQEQLARLRIEYFDQYIIHWPNPNDDLYVEAWQGLIQAKKLGWIRSIGVSNFTEAHLDRIIDETGVVPAINQVELHPYFNNYESRQANDKHGILTQAWSPLGRRLNDLLENKTLANLAKKYNKSIPQILIRWQLELGNMPIVKSSNNQHQQANLDVFDFTMNKEDIDIINGLDQGEPGRIAGQNPNTYHEYE